jgi:hypothetical protein
MIATAASSRFAEVITTGWVSRCSSAQPRFLGAFPEELAETPTPVVAVLASWVSSQRRALLNTARVGLTAAVLNMIIALETRMGGGPRKGSPKRRNPKSIPEAAPFGSSWYSLGAVEVKPILNFALRSFIFFCIDRRLGGGG